MNFQPAIPFRLTANWNAIARTIIPIDSIPGADGVSYSGFGDIQEQFFTLVEIQLEETNAYGLQFLRSLDFENVDTGQVYVTSQESGVRSQ